MKLAGKNLNKPDDKRLFPNGELAVVDLDGMSVARATFEPGWRWSNDVKPIVKTDSCQATHSGYVISGRLRVRMDDGTEVEVGPGDVYTVPPGHDGWVVGDEQFVALEWTSAAKYAKPQ